MSFSSSATAIAHNEDVLLEILVRAPSKSVLRFKSVSKHWLSLISSTDFSLFRLRNSSTRKLSSDGFLIRKNGSWKDVEFRFVSSINPALSRSPPLESIKFIRQNQEKKSGIYIRQSCNGLLLCSTSTFQDLCYYVVNPATRQYIELYPSRDTIASSSSSSSSSLMQHHTTSLHLAFDPSKSRHYKVISISSLSNGCCRIEIYSSENRHWRVVSGNSNNRFTAAHKKFDRLKEGVFWNGNIHWRAGRRGNNNIMETGLRFDINTECVENMPPEPPLPVMAWEEELEERFFGESNGHLHLIIEGSCWTTEFRVFEMESDYSGWFATYHVNLGGVAAAFRYLHFAAGELDYPLSILAVVREQNEDESVLLLHVPGKIVSYNFKDGTLKELLNLALLNKRIHDTLTQFTYERLLDLKMIGHDESTREALTQLTYQELFQDLLSYFLSENNDYDPLSWNLLTYHDTFRYIETFVHF